MHGLSDVVVVLFVAGFLVTADAGEADTAALEGLRHDLGRLLAVHDRVQADLAMEWTAKAGQGPVLDLHLMLPAFMDKNRSRPADQVPADLELLLPLRGGAWLPGSGTTPHWTRGDHRVTAVDLVLDGNGLRGTCSVTMDPAGWPDTYGKPLNYSERPEDREPFTFTVALDLARNGDQLAGTYTRPAAHGYATVLAKATGTLIVPAEPPAPAGIDPSATAAILAGAATDRYRRLRILDRMRRMRCGWDRAALRVPGPEPIPPFGTAVGILATQVARLADAATAWAADDGDDGGCPTGPQSTADPDFGPWYGESILPHVAERPNALPDDAGATGRQTWAFVGHWLVLGPLPPMIDQRERETSLPPLVSPGVGLPVTLTPAKRKDGSRRLLATWHALTPSDRGTFVTGPNGSPVADPGSGKWLRPDLRTAGATNEPRRVGFLAEAVVTAPAAATLWVGTAVRTHGTPTRLWINERLVWQSGLVDRPGDIGSAVLAVPFRAGANRLILQAEGSDFEGGEVQPFFVGICTRGAPRPAATAAAARDRQVAAIDATEAARAPIVGYLGNLRSTAPTAQPPLAWDLERGHNVRFDVPLPATTAGNAVIIGDRILTSGEPDILYCLDRETGRLRWQVQSDIFELEAPELAARATDLRAAAEAAQRAIEHRHHLKRSADDGDAAAQAKLASLPTDDGEARAAIRRWDEIARQVRWGKFPWWHQSSWSTPVTDGVSVWVKYGTGVLACYDLDGRRRWMVATGAPRIGTRPSPLLVGDAVVCLLPRRGVGRVKGYNVEIPGDDRNYELVAWDAATGAERWATPVRGLGNEGQPIVMHASDGEMVLPVICTPCGSVVRADDGLMLIRATGLFGTEWQVPAWERDRILYPMPFGSVCAGRFHLLDRDTVGFEPQWRSLNQGFSTIQSHGQYMLTTHGHCYKMACRRGTGQDLAWQEGIAFDCATGAETGRILPVFAVGDKTYAPHAAAGDHLFLLNSLNVAVCTAGPAPRVLARSRIPDTYAAPVFADDRMYLRHRTGLLCVGRTGETGLRYEREVLAAELLDGIGNQPDGSPAEVIALAPVPAVAGEPWRMARTTAPARWLFAGPFPAPTGQTVAADPDLRPEPGTVLQLGGTERTFAPLADAFVTARQQGVWYRGRYGYTEQLVLDVLGPIAKRPDCVAYYHAELVTDRERIVTVSTGGVTYARSWVDGIATEERRPYRLPPGRHHWLIEVRFRTIPPLGQLVMRPSIHEEPDPVAARAQWRGRIRERQEDLARIVSALPGSALAARAQMLLAYLEEPLSAD